ncbi:multicopper oxidase domain-containing protein [Anthocerotibacter panamensis]|uniref:multicopper oxidase domain-containing protein n=1 Tax=Anthocerotibacter panamensis TaxID=2857077 RepID=UPI001C403F8D|nr:multicopper oxidase domain-containing protein [Anthocerotibacter panamensis]
MLNDKAASVGGGPRFPAAASAHDLQHFAVEGPGNPALIVPKKGFKPYPSELQPVGPEKVKKIYQEVRSDTIVQLTDGVNYPGWSLDGKIPASVIRMRVGDTMEYSLKNLAEQGHSIDFHAANAPWDKAFHTIEPGKEFAFTWKAKHPGVFMYHCVTPLAVQHVANGMYGMSIIEPEEPLPPAREFSLVQSEFYFKNNEIDYDGIAAGNSPDYVVFNGTANQYQDYPLVAKAGELVRFYFLNVGPNMWSGFHMIGGVFDKVYLEGNPRNVTYGHQVVSVAPSGGVICEVTLDEPGLYPLVTHCFAHASKGAVGILKIV